MASALSIAFGITGPSLTCIGVILQFIDWRKSKEESSKISSLREYIDRLDDSLVDLQKEDKARGHKTKDGIDIGESFEIMQEATYVANKANKKKLYQLTDEIDRASSRREKVVKLSLFLVILGTVIWAAASFV